MNDWISVKERLPEIHERVLAFEKNTVNENMVYTCDTTIEVCYRANMCVGGWIDDAGFAVGERPFDVEITHWMPLPDEPKDNA